MNCYFLTIVFCFVLAIGGCNRFQCSNGGTCVESISTSSITAYCTCKHGYTGKHCEIGALFFFLPIKIEEKLFSLFRIGYFQCRSNGRFVDSYNCALGKYFECIYYQQGRLILSFLMIVYCSHE